MIDCARSCELEKDAARVWQACSDLENWNKWLSFNLLLFRAGQRMSWIGDPGPGGRILLEFHSVKVGEAVANIWDPPRQLHFVACTAPEEPNFWEIYLAMSPVSETRTRLELRTRNNPPSLGLLDYVCPLRWLIERKVDSVLASIADAA